MNQPAEPQGNGRSRMVVWALRVGYVGLSIAVDRI
jgi:hypothetical protein